MNKPNTSYGLRIPADIEMRTAFGSLAHCVRVTGGDVPTILFYLHNPDRIVGAGEVAPQPSEFAVALRERALVEASGVAYEAMERPTIIGVARDLGVCRPVARRALVKAGKVAA